MVTFPSDEQEPDRLAPETRAAIRWARKHAASMQVQEVSPEHLLQGLVEQGDGSIIHALGKAGIDAGALRLRIEQLFGAYSDSGLSGSELPLSKESRECLDWAYSFAWSGTTGERRPVSLPPVLLMLALIRTKQVQILLLPILPTLKSICASLLRGTWRDTGGTRLSDLAILTHDMIEALPRLPDPASLYADTPTDAWSTVEQRYAVGQIVSGVVTRALSFGVFVRIAEGIEGLLQPAEIPPEQLRRFELERSQTALPDQVLARHIPSLFYAGQRLRLRIVRIDTQRHRLALSLRDIPLEISSETLCPSCKRAVPGNWKYCAYCAAELAKVCPRCGAPCPDIEGARFCFACGHQLD